MVLSLSAKSAPRWADIQRLALVACGSALVVYLSHEFSRHGGRVASVWPLNAMLIALVLRQASSLRWPILLSGILANVVVDLWMSDDLFRAVSLSCANALEILICLRILRGRGAQDFDIASHAGLLRFALASVLGPALSAAIAALVIGGEQIGIVWLTWFAADALGLLMFAPALLVFGVERYRMPQGRHRSWEAFASGTLLAAVLALVFGQNQYPLLFIVPPFLVFAAFRWGVRGAAFSTLATAVVAIVFATFGRGPTQLIAGGELERTFVLQAFLAFLSMTTLPVAAAIMQGVRSRAELQAAHQAAQVSRACAEASERHYRTLADYSTDIVVRFGPGAIVTYISPACRILGYTPDELVGRSLLELVAEVDRPFAMTVTKDLFSGPEPDRNVLREFRVVRADGSWVWLEGAPSVVRDVSGAPVEIVSTFRDISVRKELEARLAEARLLAESGARAKSDFVANISHELRTPLNSIIGFSHLLAKSGSLQGKDRRFSELIESSSRFLLSLVNDVLDHSSLESGAVFLDPRPVDIVRLTEECVEAMRPAADAKGLTLVSVSTAKSGDWVIGDEARLRQVLFNLIGNAIKFTDVGVVTVRLIEERSDDARLSFRFEVTDTGVGMNAAAQATLFQRFSQAEPAIRRRFGGWGLGLSISKRLVELMGGTIECHSVEGSGSTFAVSLGFDRARGSSADHLPPVQRGGRQLSILVVDDVDLNCELVELLLAPLGHQIEAALSGVEALQKIEAARLDLVLMDVHMPHMDGPAAARLIRQIRPELPIVGMSARTDAAQIADCYAAGMQDFLAKPIAPEGLKLLIEKWSVAAPINPGQPDISHLQHRFLDRTRADLAVLRTAVTTAPNQGEALAVLHRIAGTAGALGYLNLSAAAGACEAEYRAQKFLTLGMVENLERECLACAS